MSNTGEDIDIVSIWLKNDPSRWIAGVISGVFSGIVMAVFAAIFAAAAGSDPTAFVKLAAVPFLGSQALDIASNQGLIVGGAIHLALCGFSGLVFAHFTGTNSVSALLGLGVAWGAFSWIFINNLFSPSFREVFVSKGSAGTAFILCMIFGLSLASVSFFHRMFGGK